MQYLSWLAVTWLVTRLPLRISYGIATAAGWAGYYCWPRGQRAMRRNYRRVLRGRPMAQVRRTGRNSLVNYCRYLVDFVRFSALSPEQLAALVDGEVEFAQMDHVLADGKGAIVTMMHFGNWDYGAAAAVVHGLPVVVIAETFSDARLDRMVLRPREQAGMRILKMESIGPSLFRCVRQNNVLALLIDRPAPDASVTVRFFGEEIEAPSGPARIALATGAPVIAAAVRRIRPLRPECRIEADFSIQVVPSGDREKDIQSLTQAMFSAHERLIRRSPDQWYMFREMWKPGRWSAKQQAVSTAASA